MFRSIYCGSLATVDADVDEMWLINVCAGRQTILKEYNDDSN